MAAAIRQVRARAVPPGSQLLGRILDVIDFVECFTTVEKGDEVKRACAACTFAAKNACTPRRNFPRAVRGCTIGTGSPLVRDSWTLVVSTCTVRLLLSACHLCKSARLLLCVRSSMRRHFPIISLPAYRTSSLPCADAPVLPHAERIRLTPQHSDPSGHGGCWVRAFSLPSHLNSAKPASETSLRPQTEAAAAVTTPLRMPIGSAPSC